jgi:hypothetical protein
MKREKIRPVTLPGLGSWATGIQRLSIEKEKLEKKVERELQSP